MSAPYRDEEHALRQRLASIDDARKRLEAERAEVAERLAAASERFSLESLRIASPCKADWGAMRGDDRVRFCGQCQKNVYNLSGMLRSEAEALVQGAEGKVCIRMYQRADGTVLTSDCPEGVARKRRRRLALVAGSGALVSASAWGYAETMVVTMGEPPPPVYVERQAVDAASMGEFAPTEGPEGAGKGDPLQPDVAPAQTGEPAAVQPPPRPALMGKPMPLPKATTAPPPRLHKMGKLAPPKAREDVADPWHK